MDKADLAVGMLVQHPWHGIGRVVSLGADSRMSPVTVRFERQTGNGVRHDSPVSPDNLTAYAPGELVGGAL